MARYRDALNGRLASLRPRRAAATVGCAPSDGGSTARRRGSTKQMQQLHRAYRSGARTPSSPRDSCVGQRPTRTTTTTTTRNCPRRRVRGNGARKFVVRRPAKIVGIHPKAERYIARYAAISLRLCFEFGKVALSSRSTPRFLQRVAAQRRTKGPRDAHDHVAARGCRSRPRAARTRRTGRADHVAKRLVVDDGVCRVDASSVLGRVSAVNSDGTCSMRHDNAEVSVVTWLCWHSTKPPSITPSSRSPHRGRTCVSSTRNGTPSRGTRSRASPSTTETSTSLPRGSTTQKATSGAHGDARS